AWRHCGELGHVVFPTVWAQLACAKLDDAPGRIEQPRVAVPLVADRGMTGIGAGEAFDGRYGLGARDGLPSAGAAALELVLGRNITALPAGKIVDVENGIGSPPRAIPFEPLTPCRDVTQVGGALSGEA